MDSALKRSVPAWLSDVCLDEGARMASGDPPGCDTSAMSGNSANFGNMVGEPTKKVWMNRFCSSIWCCKHLGQFVEMCLPGQCHGNHFWGVLLHRTNILPLLSQSSRHARKISSCSEVPSQPYQAQSKHQKPQQRQKHHKHETRKGGGRESQAALFVTTSMKKTTYSEHPGGRC